MSINVNGTVKLICAGCGKVNVINGVDICFDIFEINERAMGSENHYEADHNFTCNCGKDISLIIEVWEYPIGALNCDPEYNSNGAEMDGKFEISFDAE
jgi:hypothetical protein